ncbi:uncharacterized protein LOC131529665 [Onychostoma macrolepis]|uniref:Immunoglobulin V-set domain-containing protein n=1 Tax=Onychostoma macrolepis TaxID=369639 RepID=A0A7J6BUJ8_9TELE|nr:uncharacterized protein LOC131529665 [Onychostoma macrolepis]KAF4097985.1 hypothetical protein G5714_021993 [Onychostoma macrolepis]
MLVQSINQQKREDVCISGGCLCSVSFCSMKCDLKKKLLLFSFMLHLILNVESTHQVNGTSEENITVTFTLQDNVIHEISDKPSLYKNGNKIGSYKEISPEKFALSDVENRTVTLHITNLTLEDEGTYQVVVLSRGAVSLIESNTIYIKVTLGNKITETTTTAVHKKVVTNSPKVELSEQKPFFIFFSASVIIFICLFVGILCWLFRTYPRKSDAENPPVHSNRSTQPQGQCGTSGAVFVSCVEYGELDFQNRSERDDRVKPAEATSKDQDGVEYAAIIFPQQKQPPSGRMRNKQQVPAIKR